MSSWQPIKTAPTDWSDVLLHVPDLKSDFRTVCEGFFDTEVSRWRSPALGLLRPTHWMHLPEPPTEGRMDE